MASKQAVKAISILWLFSIAGAGCAFISQALLARHLGPEKFGAFSAALLTVMLLSPIGGFGLSQYWLKIYGKDGWRAECQLRASFRFIIISSISIFSAVIFWAVFGPHEILTTYLLCILSICIFGQVSLDLVSTIFQLEERFSALAFWQLFPHIARLILISIAILFHRSSETVILVAISYATVAFAIASLGVAHLMRMPTSHFKLGGHGPRKSENRYSNTGLMFVIYNSWPFGLATLFYSIYFQSDIVLLRYLVSPEWAGIYSVAFTIISALYLFPAVIFQKFLQPKLHRWANHDRTKFYSVYYRSLSIMVCTGIASMVLVWATATWAIPWFFGVKYAESIPLVNILAISCPAFFVAIAIGSTLVTKNHMKIKVLTMGCVAFLNIVLNLLFIPWIGAIGAAITTVISNYTLALMYFLIAQKKVFPTERQRNIQSKSSIQ